MSRFDYVRYDDLAVRQQAHAKALVEGIEIMLKGIQSTEALRAKALAVTKLEECYMWIGKAIRDEQIARGGDSNDVPERTSE